MKDILEKGLCYLSNKIEERSSKIRQKKLAIALDTFVKTVYIPDTLKEYRDLLIELINLHNKNKEIGGSLLISQINFSKYPNLKSIIIDNSSKLLPYEEVDNFIEFIRVSSKSIYIKQNSSKIIEKLSTLESLSDPEVVKTYENMIIQEYLKIVENRETKDRIVIDPKDPDNLRNIIHDLVEENKNKLRIPTGIHVFDNFITYGGFEEGRVYLFASPPGMGKSTLMINFVTNMAKVTLPKKILKSNKEPVIVYYTLENNLNETYERIARVLLKQPVRLKDADDDVLEVLFDRFSELKTRFIINYMKPGTNISEFIIDLATIAETNRIVAVFVDYLSLLTYDLHTVKEKRQELGNITFTLKMLATIHKCPIISPIQVNTAGYSDPFKLNIPTNKNIDESRQPAQNSDFVGLMFEVPKGLLPIELQYNYGEDHQRIFGINIDKNRDGPKTIIYGVSDFSIYSMSFFNTNTMNSIHNLILSKANKTKE